MGSPGFRSRKPADEWSMYHLQNTNPSRTPSRLGRHRERPSRFAKQNRIPVRDLCITPACKYVCPLNLRRIRIRAQLSLCHQAPHADPPSERLAREEFRHPVPLPRMSPWESAGLRLRKPASEGRIYAFHMPARLAWTPKLAKDSYPGHSFSCAAKAPPADSPSEHPAREEFRRSLPLPQMSSWESAGFRSRKPADEGSTHFRNRLTQLSIGLGRAQL